MNTGEEHYRRYLKGDDGGFVELVREYKDGLVFYLKSIVHSDALAEELMEETFFKLATRRPRYTGKASFKTWLYTIARNVALDHLRKQKHIADTSLEELPHTLQSENCVEASFIKKERDILLYRALMILNPAYRQVLHLTYFQGFTNTEAAAIMKKTKRQVENLLTRARKALREQLEKEGFSYEEL